jgi:1-deoxy-D-xylulose-5-phosphate synthase
VLAPRNEDEVLPMLEFALAQNGPAGIRYPRGSSNGRHTDPVAPIKMGKAEVLRRGSRVALLAIGTAVDIALDAYDTLASGEFGSPEAVPTVVNARFAKPIDAGLLAELARDHELIITVEEHSLAGGFGSAVVESVSDQGLGIRVHRIGVPDVLVQHDTQARQRALFGLSAESVVAEVARAFGTSQEIVR